MLLCSFLCSDLFIKKMFSIFIKFYFLIVIGNNLPVLSPLWLINFGGSMIRTVKYRNDL